MAELTQQEKETLTCSICGWTGKTPSLKGLSVHKGRSHKELLPEQSVASNENIEVSEEFVEDPTPEVALQPQVVSPSVPAVGAPPAVVSPSQPVQTPQVVSQSVPVVEAPQVVSAHTQELQPPPVVVEVPSLKPPVPAPQVLDPKVLGIREILIGSVLKLNGPHYIFDKNEISGPEIAEGILVKVNFRWEDPDLKQYYLRAKSEGGSQQWLIAELDVLNSNNVQLISLGEKDIPSNYKSEVPTPPEDMPESEGINLEEQKKQEEFLKALDRYVQYRDAKLKAEKEFKEADQQTRPVILDYLQQYGIESEEGKNDCMVLANGYKAHWTFTPGEDYVQRDENKILKYLVDNAILIALGSAVRWDVWEKLKENGTVPASFIAEVEKPAKRDDFRKLLIEPDHNFKS